jgi:PAS domain S-box-containing protein
MSDKNKTKAQLASELAALRRQIELGTSAGRKRTKEALRESEELWAQSPIGIELYDAEGCLLDANPSCRDMFGILDTKEIKGFKLFQDPHLPPDAKQRLLNGENVRYEAEFDFDLVKQKALYRTTKSGQCYLDVVITALETDGNVRGYMVQVQDITERKQVEAGLRRMANRQTTLYETLRAVSGQLNLDTIARSAVEAIFKFTGWSQASIIMPDEEGTHWVVRAASGRLLRASGMTMPMDKGVTGRTFRTRQTQVVPDVSVDPDYVAEDLTTRSCLTVPLKRSGRVVGVLDLESDRLAAFDPDDIILAESLADAIALTLDNAWLYAQAQRHATDLSALYAITRTTSRSLALEDVLEQALSSVIALLGFGAGLIVLAEPDNDHLRLAAARGLPSPLLERIRRQGLESTIAAYVYNRRENLVLGEDQQEAPPEVRQAFADLKAQGWRAYVGIPLLQQEQPLGAITLLAREPRPSSAYDLALLATLGQQVATAVSNARMFQTTLHERSRLQALIKSSRDGIVLIGTNGRCLVVNTPALQLLHLHGQPDEWLGRPLKETLAVLRASTPKILRAALPELRRIRTGDEPPSEGEYEASPHTVHWLNLPVLTGNVPQGRLVVLRDVTDARAVERLREDMTHTMVHDLRNPLGNISASLEALTGGMLGSLAPDQLEVLDIAQSSAYRMVELVSAILDVSRLESGQMPVDRQVFSLAGLVVDMLQLQTTLAGEKNIRLESDVPVTLPPVWADPGLIERVLQNLVGNAIKFTPPDGVIRVSARVEEKQRRPMLWVAVSDSGPGIPTEIAGQLFQKFVTGRQSGRGSGLGLAFCKLAVEAHGGRIWVESTPGHGATFKLTLALASGAP